MKTILLMVAMLAAGNANAQMHASAIVKHNDSVVTNGAVSYSVAQSGDFNDPENFYQRNKAVPYIGELLIRCGTPDPNDNYARIPPIDKGCSDAYFKIIKIKNDDLRAYVNTMKKAPKTK